MENLSPILAQRLKDLRESRGLTLAALSETLTEKYGIRISKESLTNYEVTDSFHTKARKNEGMSVKYLRCLADFYGVSTDYLLGLSPVPSNNADIQAIGEKTGLTVAAIENIRHIKSEWPEYSPVLSILLENFNLEYYLCLLRSRFSYSAREYNVPPITKQEDGVWHIKNAHEFHDSINKSEVDILFDDIHLHAKKKTLLDSMITTTLLADIKEMAEKFLERQKEKGES